LGILFFLDHSSHVLRHCFTNGDYQFASYFAFLDVAVNKYLLSNKLENLFKSSKYDFHSENPRIEMKSFMSAL